MTHSGTRSRDGGSASPHCPLQGWIAGATLLADTALLRLSHDADGAGFLFSTAVAGVILVIRRRFWATLHSQLAASGSVLLSTAVAGATLPIRRSL